MTNRTTGGKKRLSVKRNEEEGSSFNFTAKPVKTNLKYKFKVKCTRKKKWHISNPCTFFYFTLSQSYTQGYPTQPCLSFPHHPSRFWRDIPLRAGKHVAGEWVDRWMHSPDMTVESLGDIWISEAFPKNSKALATWAWGQLSAAKHHNSSLGQPALHLSEPVHRRGTMDRSCLVVATPGESFGSNRY